MLAHLMLLRKRGRNFPQRSEALIQRRTNLLCARDFGQMKLNHTSINVLQHIIDNTEEMYLYNRPLSNTDSTTHSLMNNGRIPMLGKKEDTTAEL
jgi:hypothetical protein